MQIACAMDRLQYIQHEQGPVQEYHINFLKSPCLFKRTPAWAEKGSDDYQQRIDQEMRIAYTAIVFMDTSIEDLIITLDSLVAQQSPPKFVVVVNKCAIDNRILRTTLDNYKIEWRIQVPQKGCTDLQQIDIVIDFKKLPAYLTCQAGSPLEAEAIGDINHQVFYQNKRFAILVHASGILVPWHIHNRYGGNSFGISLLDKVKEHYPDQIYKLEDFINETPASHT